MYPALIFHSFNKNPYSDKFYDISLDNFISLTNFIGEKINPKNITLTFDDGFRK